MMDSVVLGTLLNMLCDTISNITTIVRTWVLDEQQHPAEGMDIYFLGE